MDKISRITTSEGNVFQRLFGKDGFIRKEVHPNAFSYNTEDGEGRTFDYDENKRLIRIHHPNGGVTRFFSDGNGNLIKKVMSEQYQEELDDGDGFVYEYDGENRPVKEISPNGDIIHAYVYDLAGRMTKVIDGKGYLAGTTNETVGSGTRKMRNQYGYDAFGGIRTARENLPNRYTYNGEIHDRLTSQYYLRARYYSPKEARFTQEDTYREDGLNLYAFCAMNPVTYVDPSGYEFRLLDPSVGKDVTWNQWQKITKGSNSDKAYQYYQHTGKIKGTSARDIYMGNTPRKNSSVGKQVVKYMESIGNSPTDYVIRDSKGNPSMIKSLTDGNWYPFSDTDMSHKNAAFEETLFSKTGIRESGHKDAVDKWNSELKYTGARSKEVRDYMTNSDNYYLEFKGNNSKDGAKLKMTYDSPEPNSNKCKS